MQKTSNTEAEFKKALLIKKSVFIHRLARVSKIANKTIRDLSSFLPQGF